MMTNPFTDSSNITIRLIRKENQTMEDTDDRIAIVYNGEDSYCLFYKDGNVENGMTHYSILTGEELDTYLHKLFVLLTKDRDPFRYVQFNIPCMPSLLFLIEDLCKKKVTNSLSEILPLMCSCLKTHI